ncbi:hypothetical protein V1515DRAFT_602802 [Lipomyces mesembrius]
MPPKGFQISAEVESERGHVGLLGDVPRIAKALKAILDEEERREREAEKETVPDDMTTMNIVKSGELNGRQNDQQMTADLILDR